MTDIALDNRRQTYPCAHEPRRLLRARQRFAAVLHISAISHLTAAVVCSLPFSLGRSSTDRALWYHSSSPPNTYRVALLLRAPPLSASLILFQPILAVPTFDARYACVTLQRALSVATRTGGPR